MSNNDESSEGMPLLPGQQRRPAPDSAAAFIALQQQQQQAHYGATYGGSNSSSPSNGSNPNAAAYAMAAAQYDAAAAAAAAAIYSSQQPPPMGGFYPGYPPPPAPQGYYPQHPGQGQPQGQLPPSFYPAPPPPPTYNTTPPQGPPSRPPRATRRLSGKGSTPTPSPTSKAKKHLPPPQSVENTNTSTNTNASTNTHTGNDRSSIPALEDIFSNEQAFLAAVGGSGGAADGYGSTSNTANTSSSNNNNAGGRIWNAPPPRRPRGKVKPQLVQTNESGRPKHHNHRRISSDMPLRGNHRRVGSGSMGSGLGGGVGDLPPMHGHRRVGSAQMPSSSRNRSYSASGLRDGSSLGKPRHRRAESAGSMGTFTSQASVTSIVSNIAKSALFGGVTESGTVQLHFPYENVRLVMTSPQEELENITLRRGHLYWDGKTTDNEKYEEYHRVSEDMANGLAPQWESLDIHNNNNVCGCQCSNCNACVGKHALLPPPSYILVCQDTIYKRVMGEIADAHGMPCGLFFCGHHEDVAYPSIAIAVVIVTILFAVMGYVAFSFGILS